MSSGPPLWAEKYLGIPFSWDGETEAASNCWGLARMVMHDQVSVELASFSEGLPGKEDPAGRAALFEIESAESWDVVWKRSSPSEDMPCHLAKPLDMLWLKLVGHAHTGTVVSEGWMLTTMEGGVSHFVRFTEAKWKSRTLGIFRHPSLK